MSTERYPELVKLTSKKEVLKLIQCPVCLKVPFPPVFQCVNGHNICNSCKVRLVECPICKGKFSNVRNRTVEDMVLASTHVCPHKSEGCKMEGIGASIQNHVSNCEYGPFACPGKGIDDCEKDVLNLSEAKDNFLNGHKAVLFSGPSHLIGGTMYLSPNLYQQKIEMELAGLFMIEFDGSNFLSETFIHKGRLCWVVSYIGPENAAKQYRLQIICQVGEKVEIQWTVPVYSIHKSLDHKPSTDMTDESTTTFTPSCRLLDLKKTFQDNVAMENFFWTKYLLSKVETD